MAESTHSSSRTSRRKFLKGVAGGVAVSAVGLEDRSLMGLSRYNPNGWQAREAGWEAVSSPPPEIARPWLGAELWANRLQDWRLSDSRLECLAGGPNDLGRTVALLTHEVSPGRTSAHFRVRSGALELSDRGGFGGYLVGVGGGLLDYRASALAQKASGEGGGFWCGYEADGRIRFRDHTAESDPLGYRALEAETIETERSSYRNLSDEVILQLDIEPSGTSLFDVRLVALDVVTGEIRAGAVRKGLKEQDVVGGVALASSPLPEGRARFWFKDLQSSGEKIRVRKSRAVGPILSTMYSLNRNVLKMSVQLMPLSEREPSTVRLEVRVDGTQWREVAQSSWGIGYTALLKVDNWDSSRSWDYRVRYTDLADIDHDHTGIVQNDPRNEEGFTIAHLSCIMPTARGLEDGAGGAELPVAEPLGRYTSKNLHFPHTDLIRNILSHEPKLLVCAGDQIYEGNPTSVDDSDNLTLDYLYKWYLWAWAFRDLIRSTPTILQTDDHDVYQGNLWGNGGRAAPTEIIDVDGLAKEIRDQNRGGYVYGPEFINLVQRTQCGHNPDPYDATPIEQGIRVNYGMFKFGGISFAFLEDRKFKTAPIQGEDLDVHEAQLLGVRQEAFLEAWRQDEEGVDGRICLTQSLFACLQTSPRGQPLLDWDANGQPKLHRDRAIRLLRAAGALVLSGDQHLGSLIRHGIDSHTDGVVQFTGPAGVSFWQRWFEPSEVLANGGGEPYTGDFTDAFGNKLRVHAIANPKITFAYYRQFKGGRSQALGDQRLKSEGYGVVRVRRTAREYVLECWPRAVDPTLPGAGQFKGWPFRLSFDDCDGRNLEGDA